MLRATGLTRRYGGVTALSEVDIALAPGEVHAVVGENGAGKSTLVKLLSGVERPDAGTLSRLDRIALVAQELTVFPDLTVAENLFPLDPPRRGFLVSRRRMASLASPVLRELGLDVPLDARAGTLSLADQQLVEIGRALLREPAVLILDEPTSALPADAVSRLMGVLRKLVSRGVAVLYVSHFLEEVLRIATRITVLRDGRSVLAGVETASVDLDGVVAAMLGNRALAPVAQRRPPRDGPPALVVDGLFSVAPGEIVGLAGLQGAGHLEVLAALSGRGSGTGMPRSVRAAVRAGVAFVPSDRKRYGLMLDKPLWQNTSAAAWLGAGRGGWWLHRRAHVSAARRSITRLRIRGGPDDLVATLSGGNQQKVVFAKWLEADPRLLVLDDPTRGVDVGARAEMHAVISSLAAAGTPVVLASTDLAELCELCDRVLVFQRGRVVARLTRSELSERALSVAMNAGT
ncbi:ribose transport system ATP-binding protein/rhamnose transport system ATP-binding protein [Amycolatopsis pretoriensis]|uniref:Ribose transport system ATP-binding protein/rhamnose transport system ATP-binding protein n=1 Tax=Amycolatopsis pretoriensis TaxID=218821 RepID=A0A1H5QJ22_9PSEU|nr:sugar ABC transporter ATP-binding protein [Amycolatopsis pretoriensis]SEF26110.1 ribose transport system ATP-binding protein/rhamnose transport system ATP-binding protein [Amycolatopsis pretoriensis]